MSNSKIIKSKLFRDTYNAGKTVHKNKEIIITKIWRVVTSKGEQESCDRDRGQTGVLRGRGTFYFLSLVFV